MKPRRDVAGFVLAGGASSRMGRDKGLLEFGGVPLVVHLAQRIEPLVARVTLVGAPRGYAQLGLPIIPDHQAAGRSSKIRRGPLAGIAAALAATHSTWNLLVACDLPYLSVEWLGWLVSRATKSRAQAVVPQTERGLEPLAAMYRRKCGTVIAATLTRGERKVANALEELQIERVYPREWRPHDPQGLVLRNMNTPQDYDEARKWWDAQQPREDASARTVRKRLRTTRIPAKAKGAGTWHPPKKL